jgi:hypothetical protein
VRNAFERRLVASIQDGSGPIADAARQLPTVAHVGLNEGSNEVLAIQNSVD